MHYSAISAPPPRFFLVKITAGLLWLLASFIILSTQAQAQNATGEPAVTAADSTDLTMVGPNEDIALTAAQGTIADADGITTFTPTWAWQQADAPASGTPMDSAYSAITGATAATFTPLQEHVGKFLRVCAAFEDDDGNDETRCWTSVAAVVNRNYINALPSSVDVPVGRTYRFRLSDFRHEDEEGADYGQPGFSLESFPADGTIRVRGAIPQGIPYALFLSDFSQAGGVTYTPPADATVSSDYARFDFLAGSTTSLSYGVGPAATMTINLVANSAPDFGDASAANQIWLTNTALSLTLPEATSGNGTLAYTLAPSLPAGLTFDAASRTISGTPTAASAVAEYTLTATDIDGETSTLTFRAAVQADAPPAFATNATIADQAWATGNAITALVLPEASGGNGALTYTLTPALPAGLSFDAATRTLSGTPTAEAEQATYTYTAADADNNTASGDAPSLTFSITVEDAPQATDIRYPAPRSADGTVADTITIPASLFTGAYTDPDGDDLASVTITELPDSSHGTLNLGEGAAATAVTANQSLTIADGDFENGPLTFTRTAEILQQATLMFTLSDGTLSSNAATLTIAYGTDIAEQEVIQASAILSATAITNATTAISGAIAAPATDLSIDGTSLKALTQTLHQSKTVDSPHHAWYHSTTANWEYTAAYNAADNSRASLLNRLQSMANGDIAINYSLTDMSTMRFWARYQSLDINGNEGESLEYDGSGTGFYIGADNQITETMRIGLAIGTDSSDITLDLDEDGTDDEATRSATSFYPYLHIDLGNNNNARVIAGFGSGTLDIKSTANSNSTASADLSWNMLAASISHHRPMKGNLSARFDGSLQLGNTSTDETTFSSGSTLMAADSSTNELSINAELRYQSNNITPFASLATRKLGGDLSQSVALDMAFGADLQTSPANLRIAITRQINDTTHQRHSISIDASTRPNPSGISASLGSRYDSITGRPQWNTTIGWQRRNFHTSLQASPGDYRLRARLRW